MITIENAFKSFGDRVMLDGVNLRICGQSIVGLAGPSGSGKSTLLRCIQGLESLDRGVIRCDGRTGFMFQDFQLFPHMSVWKNIVYAPRFLAKGKKPIINLDVIAANLMQKLGIFELRDRYPANLSGGQKQRVALARSLILSPNVLLCDEPTSGLDIATIDDVVSLLQSIRNQETAMIIASHDLDFLTRISDRILLLKRGKIIVDMALRDFQNPVDYLKRFYSIDAVE